MEVINPKEKRKYKKRRKTQKEKVLTSGGLIKRIIGKMIKF